MSHHLHMKYCPVAAIRQCIDAARVLNGLLPGLRDSLHALESEQVFMCCVASNAEEYIVHMFEALCEENNVPLFRDCSGQEIGEYCGLYKLDQAGNPCKIVNTPVFVITKLPCDFEPFYYLTEILNGTE
ncbi:hypothetical protein P9112_000556 [Eukaryota sp. TZLM1-RC]